MSRSDFIARWKALVVAQEPRDMIDELQDGRTISMHFQPLPAGGWVTTHEDVTERSRAEARSLFMARHDALTGLPNRVMFYERLEKAARSAGRGHGWAVLCLDLDHFKLVNDTLGHPVGDGLLRAAADRLRACVREADTVARLNGDEFAIIQHGVQGPVDVELLAGRILAVFSTPFNIDGHDIVVGISIGITVAPEDGIASDKLLKNAGIALYLAKLESRGTVRYFEPEMNARIQRRRLLELDLRGAVERNEFALYYQPLINLATDGVAGFEALIRWHHPVRGVVPPSDFIPLAEETGLIVAIGDWALRAACLEAATWPDDISVAVNLSSIQFKRGDLVTSVRAALAASGLSPERLELEITESVLLLDSDATLAVLHALHAMGIVVALDDFGTGYSSLSYLRSFPFGKIKIDQSFVRDMLCNKESVSIIRAVTGLGQSLSMKTTAEGVETQAQLDRLRQEGCTEVQGYFFSRPKPADEVPMMIQTLRQDASRAAVQVVPSLDSVPAE